MARSTRSWAISAAAPRTLTITPATNVDKYLRIGGLSSKKVNIARYILQIRRSAI
jgi:hypothetical protein